jgi:hypothetical protein
MDTGKNPWHIFPVANVQLHPTTEDSMAQPAQLDDLAAKHRALERIIAEEQEHLGSDDLKVAELKRKKLKLKDEIAGMEAETRH